MSTATLFKGLGLWKNVKNGERLERKIEFKPLWDGVIFEDNFFNFSFTKQLCCVCHRTFLQHEKLKPLLDMLHSEVNAF